MKNKKGISIVVATVLILLITVAAAAVIAGVIIPFIKNSLDQSTECIPYQKQFSFDSSFEYNCYRYESNQFNYKISVKSASMEKTAEESLIGANIIVSESETGNSKVIQLKQGTGGSCANGGIRNLEDVCNSNSLGNVIPPKGGETRSYVYTSNKQLKGIEIGALLKSGKQCEISDSIKQIPPCI